MLIAQTNAKLEAMGKKKVEFINPNIPRATVPNQVDLTERPSSISTTEVVTLSTIQPAKTNTPTSTGKSCEIYVMYMGSLISGSGKVYSKTTNSLQLMSIIEGDFPHYSFKSMNTNSLNSIELKVDYDLRIPLKLDPNKGIFICANYHGETMYFSSRDSCEQHIRNLFENNSVLVCFRRGDIELTTVSEVQVLENETWKSLKKTLRDNRMVFPYECKKGNFRVQLRWKKDQKSPWNYDWLYMERSYFQIFEENLPGTITMFSQFGKSYYPVQQNNFDIKIDDSAFTYQKRKELIDSMTAVIKWYGLDVELIHQEQIRLKSLDDQVKVNRAFKKHFESCQMSPILSKQYPNDYLSNQVTVRFYGKVSDEEIASYFRSIGVSKFYSRERSREPVKPVEVTIILDDVITPSFLQTLEKIYASTLVFSVRSYTAGSPPLD